MNPIDKEHINIETLYEGLAQIERKYGQEKETFDPLWENDGFLGWEPGIRKGKNYAL